MLILANLAVRSALKVLACAALHQAFNVNEEWDVHFCRKMLKLVHAKLELVQIAKVNTRS